MGSVKISVGAVGTDLLNKLKFKINLNMFKNILFVFLAALGISSQLQAQIASCTGDTAAALSGNTTPIVVSLTATIPSPTLTRPSIGLPNMEYLVINRSRLATDSAGAAIVGATPNGIFRPDSLGIRNCEEFQVIPISYDLHQLRVLTQSLLTGNYAGTVTCCAFLGGFAAGFCDSLTALGITDSSDIRSLSDFFRLASILQGAGSSLSMRGAISTISQINGAIGFLGGCSGGVTRICYAVDTTMADLYTSTGSLATGVQISPDPATVNGLGNSVDLTAQFSPVGSCPDALFWGFVGTVNSASINSSTGKVTGNSVDTVQVYAVSFRDTLVRDTITVYIRSTVGVENVEANASALQFQAQPNPFNQQLQIRIQAVENQAYNLRLMNLAGQILIQNHSETGYGLQTVSLETAHLPAGVYVVQLQTADKLITQKVIKQ